MGVILLWAQCSGLTGDVGVSLKLKGRRRDHSPQVDVLSPGARLHVQM